MDEARTFGGYFKELRMRSGKTLRQFCLDNKLDPGNMSRIERGKAAPPLDEAKLAAWAGMLGLKRDSKECSVFYELASIDAGRIPKEIMDDKVLLGKLPLVFRTLRGEKLTEAKLRELIELIRKS